MPHCKYQRLRKQISTDGGTTWQNTDEYAAGALIEYNSASCSQRIEYVTTGGTTVQIPCTSTTYTASSVTQSEVRSNTSYTAMTAVTVGGCVQTVAASAFTNCSNLQDVVVDEGVTNINGSAFKWNFNVRSIDLPSTITTIANDAFNLPTGTSQTYVTSITCRATNPPTIYNNTFVINNPSGAMWYIYVPSGSVNAYKSAAYWTNFASKIIAIPS